MARVRFTQNLQRHVECPPTDAPGHTVRAVLDAVFAANPRVRGYVLDEQGEVRRHMIVFVDGRAIKDRKELSDAVPENGEVFVMQALSGG
jgi:hypothetical protein